MHWTYTSLDTSDDLHQGDILLPSAQLLDLLRIVHPHFANPKYTAFMILTQTCDLAIRNSACKTPHITLCVVRAIAQLLPSLIRETCSELAPGIYKISAKDQVHRLLERVLNQNEQSLGLYYLHPDESIGIAEHCVAQLRISVALRAEHYEILRSARRGRTHAEFESKLGWLTGNLYSRVATPDWHEKDPDMLRELLGSLTEQVAEDGHVYWADDAAVKTAKKNGVSLSDLTPANAEGILKEHRPKPAVMEAIDLVAIALRKHASDCSDDQIRVVCNSLRNDSNFSNLLRKNL